MQRRPIKRFKKRPCTLVPQGMMIGAALAVLVFTAGDRAEFRFKHSFGDRELTTDAMGQTALVDLDRDGDLDFITGQRNGPITWYEYQGAQRWVRHRLGEDSPSDVGGGGA